MYKTTRNLTVLGLGLSASAIVGWLLLKQKKAKGADPTLTIKSQHRQNEVEDMPQIVLPREALENAADEPAATGTAVPASPDDLTKINDIGPRFAEALATIGITSFEQLAQQDPDTLTEQLSPHVSIRAQRIRDKNWIEQAAELAQQH